MWTANPANPAAAGLMEVRAAARARATAAAARARAAARAVMVVAAAEVVPGRLRLWDRRR